MNSAQRSRGDTPARANLFMRSHRRLLGGFRAPGGEIPPGSRLHLNGDSLAGQSFTLLDEFALRVADFNFAEVQLFHLVFNL